MEERRLDLNVPNEERYNEIVLTAKLLHRMNNAEPFSEEYNRVVEDIFEDRKGKNCIINAPFYCTLRKNITVGNNVAIMPYFKAMSAGQITIEDNVQIAFGVTVITNNHDIYERNVILIKDVTIKKKAWIGANATILPGVTIGENAIVGAGSVVTKDVEPNTIVVGNPARPIKKI